MWRPSSAHSLASALAASAASGAVPEFGRCVPAEPAKTGEYAGAGCVSAAAGHKGSYNWLAGPGAKPKFTAFAGPVTLETVGGSAIACSNGTVNGEYTGAKTASATISVVGCIDVATEKLCQTNPVLPGELEATGLEGELGFIVGGDKTEGGLAAQTTDAAGLRLSDRGGTA